MGVIHANVGAVSNNDRKTTLSGTIVNMMGSSLTEKKEVPGNLIL